MSFCQRALLLSVVFVLCVKLPTMFCSVSNRRLDNSGKHGDTERSELIDLLKKLRLKLNDEREAERSQHSDHKTSITKHKKTHLKSDNGFTDEQKNQLLDAINAKRRSVGATNMNLILWSNDIANLAQHWVNDCDYKRGIKPFNADLIGFFKLGQTLWAFNGDFDAKKIVDHWFNDDANFNPDNQCGFNQACGGRRQLLNARSSAVGCGLKQCSSVAGQSDHQYISCYFGPGYYYHERAFTSGAACSECLSGQFYCNNGLCDTTCKAEGSNCECKADCKNCGSKTADCKCKCKPGSSGVNCEDACTDFNPKCNAEYDGWPKAQCLQEFPYVLEDCPKMCGLCTQGNPCGKNDDD
jgi:hypothetical protein